MTNSHPFPGQRTAASPGPKIADAASIALSIDSVEFMGPGLGASRQSGNWWMAALLLTLALTACASYPIGTTPPHRLPTQGQIAYACANGARLLVEFVGDEARVAVAGGPSMVLPRAGENYFSNGRYAIRGGAAQAQWEVGRAAPVNCRGN